MVILIQEVENGEVMKLMLVGEAQPGGVVVCGKVTVHVTNVSKEPYELPTSGLVVLEADNFSLVDNGEGVSSLHVNVLNSGLISAGGGTGLQQGKVSVFMPVGVSRNFEMVQTGTLHSGSVAVSQGYGDRATSLFLDSILFRMPSPLVKGDQILVEGTFEDEAFVHQGRNRSKVKLVINSYQRQKGNKPRDNGGNAPAGNAPAGNTGGGFSKPAGNAPAGNNSGGFNRPSQAPAGNTPAGNSGGGFSKPAGNTPAANSGGGFGRGPQDSNLPEIDINEDEIPF